MRKSIVLFVVASVLATLAGGCMPNAEGPFAFSPRTYAYAPVLGPGPSAESDNALK